MSENWLDRTNYKAHIHTWIKSERLNLLLTTSELQEIEDSTDWIKNTFSNFQVVTVFLNSSDDTPGISLMNQITESLGNKKFKKYIKLKKTIAKTEINAPFAPIMGKDIVSGQQVNFIENSQTQIFDKQISPIYQLESQKSDLVSPFLNELAAISKKNKLLLICRLADDVEVEFNKDFLYWFKNIFLRNLNMLSSIKVCFISNSKIKNYDLLVKYTDHLNLSPLCLTDILPVAKGKIEQHETFCKAIVSLEFNEIDYRTFKLKLEKFA